MAPVTAVPPTFIDSVESSLNLAIAILTAIAASGAAISAQYGFNLSQKSTPPERPPGAFLTGGDLNRAWVQERGKRQRFAARAKATQSIGSALALASAVFGASLALPFPLISFCLSAAAVAFSIIFIIIALHNSAGEQALAQATVVYLLWKMDWTQNNPIDNQRMLAVFQQEHPLEDAVLRRANAYP